MRISELSTSYLVSAFPLEYGCECECECEGDCFVSALTSGSTAAILVYFCNIDAEAYITSHHITSHHITAMAVHVSYPYPYPFTVTE